MSRSNDLVPYLGGGGNAGDNWRQGVILSWNPLNGENSVSVGGAVFTNLPFMNTTEASLFQAGDVVILRKFGASFAIEGRIFYPGSAEAISAFQAITNRIQVASNSEIGTRNSTSWGDLTGTAVGPSVTIDIGTSGRALVFWGAEMGGTVNWQVRNTPHVGVQVSGATSVSPTDLHALNYAFEFPTSGNPGHAQMSSWIQCSTFHLYTGLNSGSNTFTMKYRHDTIAPAGTVSFNAREIAVFAL